METSLTKLVAIPPNFLFSFGHLDWVQHLGHRPSGAASLARRGARTSNPEAAWDVEPAMGKITPEK
jgi:hypothetical protein